MKTEAIVHLYEDTRWKAKVLSKLEIVFDDLRNSGGVESFSRFGENMEYGKSYKITMTIEEIE